MEQRRADRRYDRRVAVDFRYEGALQAGQSRNLSLQGMFLETDLPLPYGARIELSFRVPTQREPIEVAAQVRWSAAADDPGGRGVGLRFEGLRARDVWALNKFFDRPPE
jgi:uncharacterized protein (TIGR02266 family)